MAIDAMTNNTCMNKFKKTIDLPDFYTELIDQAQSFIRLDKDYQVGRRTDEDYQATE